LNNKDISIEAGIYILSRKIEEII